MVEEGVAASVDGGGSTDTKVFDASERSTTHCWCDEYACDVTPTDASPAGLGVDVVCISRRR